MRTTIRVLAAAMAALTLAACGGTAAAHHATPRPAVPSARAAADCSKLSASQLPLVAYDQLLIGEVSRIAHGGIASAAQERTARAAMAAAVRASCPQFTYLIAEDQ